MGAAAPGEAPPVGSPRQTITVPVDPAPERPVTVVLPDIEGEPEAPPPPQPTPLTTPLTTPVSEPTLPSPPPQRPEPRSAPRPRARPAPPEPASEPAKSRPTAQRTLRAAQAAVALGAGAGDALAGYAKALRTQAARKTPAALPVGPSRLEAPGRATRRVGAFLPPVAPAGSSLAGNGTEHVTPVALVAILAGIFVLLATLLPSRAWALAGIVHPDQVRGAAMLLGLGSLLIGLVVLVAAS